MGPGRAGGARRGGRGRRRSHYRSPHASSQGDERRRAIAQAGKVCRAGGTGAAGRAGGRADSMNGRQKAVRKRSSDGEAQKEEPAFGRAASTAPTPSGNLLRPLSVAIVGLGLMGGSLALALQQRRAVKKIIGISRQRATLEAALARGAVDEASDQLEAARGADIIILATPARTILRQ